MHTDPPPCAQAAPSTNQFALLAQRRFAPFFWTQFCGAANDNLFKFAFTVLVTYQLQVAWLPPSLAGLVIGALFILPFVLLSATAGQLCDKWDKTRMFRLVKRLEVAIMLVAAWGFWQSQVAVLLGCVLLMGVHSTLFGPAKYAYLPQALHARELTGGNALVEMGTFVSILLGNMAGGVLVAIPQVGPLYVAAACVVLALIGWACAQKIPSAPAVDPQLRINWNAFSETWRNLQLARAHPVVFRSLLGISWMWFFGAVFLSQFPSFAKEVLHGNEHVASLLLVVFSIGVGAGALLCELLGRQQVEIGLVPLGALGMSVFAIDLYGAVQALPPVAGLWGWQAFVTQPAHWRVMFDLGAMALSVGLYSVPMYALIQLRSQPSHRARIIAANNILNALFMVVSAVLAAALLGAGCSIAQVFLFTGVANLLVAAYVFVRVPEYLLRLLAWGWTQVVHRVQVQGGSSIAPEGPTLMVACSDRADAPLWLLAASPRPLHIVRGPQAPLCPRLARVLRWARTLTAWPAPLAQQAHAVMAADAARQVQQAAARGDAVLLLAGNAAQAQALITQVHACMAAVVAEDVRLLSAALQEPRPRCVTVCVQSAASAAAELEKF